MVSALEIIIIKLPGDTVHRHFLFSAGSITKYTAWRERSNQSTGFIFCHLQVLVQMR